MANRRDGGAMSGMSHQILEWSGVMLTVPKIICTTDYTRAALRQWDGKKLGGKKVKGKKVGEEMGRQKRTKAKKGGDREMKDGKSVPLILDSATTKQCTYILHARSHRDDEIQKLRDKDEHTETHTHRQQAAASQRTLVSF